VCRAVARGHADGVVTSTSLLAVGRAFGSAVRVLRDAPGLDGGAHLAMVGEDPPLLTPREIPTLVNKQGRFPLSYRTVLARGFARRIDPEDVRREFTAQVQRIRAAGVHISHVDTHQHVHLWPAVARVVTELAKQERIPAVRTPASHRLLPVGLGVNALASRLRRRLAATGLATTDSYTGLDEAGAFDAARFETSLTDLRRGSGSVEINVHPGEAGDPDLGRFSWGYRWPDELAMLLAPRTRSLIDAGGFRLGTFADLTTRPPAG
jgi:predicted glycoside hydrolase/deacetylase ChbG (UPF0249 family)